MTPERLKAIKNMMEEEYARPDAPYSGRFVANAPYAIADLLAALEEAEKPDIKSINKIKKLEADLQSALAVNQKYLCDIERINSKLAEAQQTIAGLEMVRAEERGYHERDCIEYQQTIARQGEIIHGIDRDLTKLRLALIAIAGIDIIGSSAITMKAIAQEALGEGAKEEWEFQIKPGDKVLVDFRHLKGQELPVSANHAHKRLISVIAPDGLWNVAYGDFEKAGEGAKESC